MNWFDQFTDWAAYASGTAAVFVGSCLLTVVWLASGFWTGFDEDWNFWANTSTTVLTFLLVFIIQHTQNRNDRALHLKLDELIRAVQGARNELMGAERQPEQVLEQLADSAFHTPDTETVQTSPRTRASGHPGTPDR